MKSPAPGPYTHGPKGDRGGFGVQTICVMDANGRNIATVYGKEDGEKQETAKLLAAAHEMFDLISKIHSSDAVEFYFRNEIESVMKKFREV